MQLDELTDEQKTLWSRVDALWQMATAGEQAAVGNALHPNYTGWVTGQARPHDRDEALASIGPSSPRILSYDLQPLSIRTFDGIVGVVHYRSGADVESGANTAKPVAGRWTEIYLLKNREWKLISVSGGPDGER